MKKVLCIAAVIGIGALVYISLKDHKAIAKKLEKPCGCGCNDCDEKAPAPAPVEIIPAAAKVSHTSADETGIWDTPTTLTPVTLDDMMVVS